MDLESPRQKKSFFNDLSGLFSHPGNTLGRLTQSKNYFYSFFFLSISIFLLTYLSIPHLNKELGHFFSQEQLEFLAKPTALHKAIFSFLAIFALFLKLVIVAFFLYLFYGIGGISGNFVHFFTISIHAAIIGTLIPSLLDTISLICWQSKFPHLSLALIMPSKKMTSLPYIFLSQVELFSIWFAVAVAKGISVYGHISQKRSYIIMVFFMIFKITILSLFIFLMLKLKSSLIMQ